MAVFALFLLVLLLLPAIFRRGGFEFAWGIILSITNLFLSYTRFVTMAVPDFIVLSKELRNGDIRYWLTAAAVGVFQLILLFRHINLYLGGLMRQFSARRFASSDKGKIEHLV